jgi:hypothetical protein
MMVTNEKYMIRKKIFLDSLENWNLANDINNAVTSNAVMVTDMSFVVVTMRLYVSGCSTETYLSMQIAALLTTAQLAQIRFDEI